MRLIHPNVEIIELHNYDYARKERGIIRIISKEAAVHELGKNPEWLQTFWDSTSRRTASLMIFAAAILDEDNETVRTTELDCRKFERGETSEETINALM